MLPFAGMLIGFSAMLDLGENFQVYKDEIVVTDCRIAFGETKSDDTVAVIGTIKNMSKVPWEDVNFHADFLTLPASAWMWGSVKNIPTVC